MCVCVRHLSRRSLNIPPRSSIPRSPATFLTRDGIRLLSSRASFTFHAAPAIERARVIILYTARARARTRRRVSSYLRCYLSSNKFVRLDILRKTCFPDSFTPTRRDASGRMMRFPVPESRTSKTPDNKFS